MTFLRIVHLLNKTGEYLYDELWKLCAGPLVDVPRAEERVYYFPQGHMEQVSFSFLFDFFFLFQIGVFILVLRKFFSIFGGNFISSKRQRNKI